MHGLTIKLTGKALANLTLIFLGNRGNLFFIEYFLELGGKFPC